MGDGPITDLSPATRSSMSDCFSIKCHPSTWKGALTVDICLWYPVFSNNKTRRCSLNQAIAMPVVDAIQPHLPPYPHKAYLDTFSVLRLMNAFMQCNLTQGSAMQERIDLLGSSLALGIQQNICLNFKPTASPTCQYLFMYDY